MQQDPRSKAITDNGAIYVLWATTYGDAWIRSQPYFDPDRLDHYKDIYSFMKFNGAGIVFTDCPTPSTTFVTAEAAEAARVKHIAKMKDRIATKLGYLHGTTKDAYIDQINGTITILENTKILKLAATEVTL